MPTETYSHSRFLFARCAIGSNERVWFLVSDGSVYRMLQLKEGRWIQKSVPWGAIGICGRTDPEVELYIVGANGECLRGTATGFSEEKIDPKLDRPNTLGIMRDARFVDGQVFAVGMSRQAYRRGPLDGWQFVADGMISDRTTIRGLNSIDGLSLSNVLAVGLGGEVWNFDGTNWQQLESSTNLSLNKVCVVSEALAYACGQSGILLEISRGNVKTVVVENGRQNLFGLTWFKNKLYLASSTAIFSVNKGELLPLQIGLGSNFTTGFLESDKDTLWSVGAHHLAYSKDGESWTLLKCSL